MAKHVGVTFVTHGVSHVIQNKLCTMFYCYLMFYVSRYREISIRVLTI